MPKLPKKSDPLTPDEMTEAADEFMTLFNIVDNRMPDDSKVEDTIKVMESVAKLGHKKRGDKLMKERDETFGFNKVNVKTDESS